MIVRLDWPGSVRVGHALGIANPRYRLVSRDPERAIDNYAPWFLAWLYVWLPIRLGWFGRDFEGEKVAPYYLWTIWAARWFLAWLPRRRRPEYGGRLGTLVVSFGRRQRKVTL